MGQGGKNGILEDLRDALSNEMTGEPSPLGRMEEESRVCYNKYGLGEGQGGEDRW